MMPRDPIPTVTTLWGDRRHLFPQADGRQQQCGGPGKCRECNREEDQRRAEEGAQS